MPILRYMLGDEILRHGFRDGRGKRVVLNYLKLRAAAEKCPDPLAYERLKSCHRAIRSQGRVIRIIIAGLFLSVGLAITSLMIWVTMKSAPASRSSGFSIGIIIAPLFFVALGVGILRGAFGYNPARVTRTMVAHSICPACLQFLDDAALHDDGCGVCPGCGSAWKLL